MTSGQKPANYEGIGRIQKYNFCIDRANIRGCSKFQSLRV